MLIMSASDCRELDSQPTPEAAAAVVSLPLPTMGEYNNLVLPELAEVSMEFGVDNSHDGQPPNQPQNEPQHQAQAPYEGDADASPQFLDGADWSSPALTAVSSLPVASAAAHPGFTAVGSSTGGPVTFQGPAAGLQMHGVSPAESSLPPPSLAYLLAQQVAGYDPLQATHGVEESVDVLGDGQPMVPVQPSRAAMMPRQTQPAALAEISQFIGNWDAIINIAEVCGITMQTLMISTSAGYQRTIGSLI